MSAGPQLRYYPNVDWMTKLARNKFIEKNIPRRARRATIGRFAHPKDRIRYWNVAVGDTVQIMVGKNKGKVATVISADKERNMIKLDQHELVKKWVKIPQEGADAEPKSEMAYRPKPIHVSNVRVKLGDRELEGGRTEEVFAKRIARRDLRFDIKRKKWAWVRVAPMSQSDFKKGEEDDDSEEIVPWPKGRGKPPAPDPTLLDTVPSVMAAVQEKYKFTPDSESHPFPEDSFLSLEEAFARLRPSEWSERTIGGLSSESSLDPAKRIKTTRNGRPIPLGLFSERERSLYAPLTGAAAGSPNEAVRYSLITDELRNAWSRARRTRLWNEENRPGHYERKAKKKGSPHRRAPIFEPSTLENETPATVSAIS